MTDLSDMLIKNMREQSRLQPEFSINEMSTIFFLELFQDLVTVEAPYVVASTRNLGSSFILGHAGLGWLGPVVAGSVAVGSQPYLGDSRGAWILKSIDSPNHIFRETFAGSRFKSGNSTCDWVNGSAYFTSGEKLETESIYLGSQPISSIEVELAGSTINYLGIHMSPDGNQSWEACNSASIYPYKPTNTGSNLMVRLTEMGGSMTLLNEFKVTYTL
jgi:hypothetical protein